MTITICIVEDDMLIAEDISEQLRRLGYKICGIAQDGEEAVTMIPEKKPDLVLMDIMLKGKMTGIETSEILEKQFKIPVIFLTGVAKHKIDKLSLADPCNFVSKPFSDEELQKCIENALKHYQIPPAVPESLV